MIYRTPILNLENDEVVILIGIPDNNRGFQEIVFSQCGDKLSLHRETLSQCGGNHSPD
jgi:hypothetical protein